MDFTGETRDYAKNGAVAPAPIIVLDGREDHVVLSFASLDHLMALAGWTVVEK